MNHRGNPGRLPFCEAAHRLIDAGEKFYLVSVPGSNHNCTVSDLFIKTAKKRRGKEKVKRPQSTRLNFYEPVQKGGVYERGEFQFWVDAADHHELGFIVNTCATKEVKEEVLA